MGMDMNRPMDTAENSKTRIAFWNDISNGRQETVLWLERDRQGKLWLTDHADSAPVEPAEVDPLQGEPAVREWCATVGMEYGDLRCTEFSGA